ncbi:MAG: PhzF family phenazine biosynthesis protein [Salibacteraceae bacterium]
MNTNDFYLVNVFTGDKARGNQACVVLLDDISDSDYLLSIAADFNLPATTFLKRTSQGFQVRWFAPMAEIDLCGHGTVAATWILCKTLKSHTKVSFDFDLGRLTGNSSGEYVAIEGERIPYEQEQIPTHVEQGFQGLAKAYYTSYNKHIVVFDDERSIQEVNVNWDALRGSDTFGYVITAPSEHYDCTSRVLLPHLPFLEDQATGSAHLLVAPFWSQQLGKKSIHAYQASERGGVMRCTTEGDLVRLEAQCNVFGSGCLSS